MTCMGLSSQIPAVSIGPLMRFRAAIVRAVPSRVHADYLRAQLRVENPKTARNYLAELRAVKLIDDAGVPTEAALKLRSDETFREGCEIILREAYPPEFLESFRNLDDVEQRVAHYCFSEGDAKETARRKGQTFAFLLDGKPADVTEPRHSVSRNSGSQSPTMLNIEGVGVPVAPMPPEAKEGPTVEARYWLSKNRYATVRVPPDITQSERKRLFAHLQIDMMVEVEDESE